MSKQAMTMALDALQSCTYDDEGYCLIPDNEDAITALRAALDAPEPTVPDNMQDWKGMDGAIAWHLIERHADNWADIGKMMGEWLAANQTVLDVPEREPLSDARITSLAYDCNAMPESCTDESLKLFAHAIEQEVRGK